MIIRGHDLETHTVEQFDELNKLYGITGYQLALKKSFDINSKVITDTDIESIDKSVFINTRILGAYFNPAHPDDNEVSVGIENFVFNMKLADRYGIKHVATETGSVLGSPWDYHPNNHLPITISEVTNVFKEISKRSNGIDVNIAIEPAYHHVIKDLDTLIEFTKNVNDPRIVYVLDLYNLLNAKTYQDYKLILAEFLNAVGEKIKIFHLKDFVVIDDRVKQVDIGEGIVDFEYVLKEINNVVEEPLFVLEGTVESKMANAISKIVV
ncbi:MAG: sugar phosphate isomerase/epimerase family protein [Coprobacillaceae bacterium]